MLNVFYVINTLISDRINAIIFYIYCIHLFIYLFIFFFIINVLFIHSFTLYNLPRLKDNCFDEYIAFNELYTRIFKNVRTISYGFFKH